jgi:rRNA processing
MESFQLAQERRKHAKEDRMNRLTKYRRMLKREGLAGTKRARDEEGDEAGAAEGRAPSAGRRGGEGARPPARREGREGKARRTEGKEGKEVVKTAQMREEERKKEAERRAREKEEKKGVRKRESRVMRGKTRFGQPLLSKSIAVLTARIERRNPELAQQYYSQKKREKLPLDDADAEGDGESEGEE